MAQDIDSTQIEGKDLRLFPPIEMEPDLGEYEVRQNGPFRRGGLGRVDFPWRARDDLWESPAIVISGLTDENRGLAGKRRRLNHLRSVLKIHPLRGRYPIPIKGVDGEDKNFVGIFRVGGAAGRREAQGHDDDNQG